MHVQCVCGSDWLVWGAGLTGEASPASHVAGSLVGQDEAGGGQAGGLDLIRQLDGVVQPEQGNVITDTHTHTHTHTHIHTHILGSITIW